MSVAALVLVPVAMVIVFIIAFFIKNQVETARSLSRALNSRFETPKRILSLARRLMSMTDYQEKLWCTVLSNLDKAVLDDANPSGTAIIAAEDSTLRLEVSRRGSTAGVSLYKVHPSAKILVAEHLLRDSQCMHTLVQHVLSVAVSNQLGSLGSAPPSNDSKTSKRYLGLDRPFARALLEHILDKPEDFSIETVGSSRINPQGLRFTHQGGGGNNFAAWLVEECSRHTIRVESNGSGQEMEYWDTDLKNELFKIWEDRVIAESGVAATGALEEEAQEAPPFSLSDLEEEP